MKKRAITRVAFFGTLALASFSLAQIATDVVKTGKASTAFVEIKGPNGRSSGSATAFCIDSAGYFVTNKHVSKAIGTGTAKLVLNSSEADELVVDATVLREDPDSDLALLKVNAKGSFAVLDMGDSNNLIETTSVTAFGYPFGRQVSADKASYPSISVSVGRVTSLRKVKGVLNEIQLDASLNPGNSGGPVLDEKGKVVGIVSSGVAGAALNFAVPVEKLKAFIQKPDVTFTPPAVPFDQRTAPADWTVNLKTIDHSPGDYVVEITLPGPRTVTLKPDPSGKYTATAAPLQPVTGPARLHANITFPGGSLTGDLLDQDVNVGKSMKLSDITRVDHTGPAGASRIIPRTGDPIAGGFTAATPVTIDLGPTKVSIDLASATTLDIAQPPAPQSQVPYTLTVKKGGQAVFESSGAVSITSLPQATTTVAGSPATGPAASQPVAAAPASIHEPVDRVGAPEFTAPDLGDSGKSVVALPGTVDQVVAGGGGRFLILRSAQLSQLLVFDISQAKVVLSIPLPAGDITYTASLTKIMVGLREANAIQRWDINTLKREVTTQGPEGGLTDLAMGYNANTPLFASGPGGTVIINPKTMRSEPFNWAQRDGGTPSVMRLSSDGSVCVSYGYMGWAGTHVSSLSGYVRTSSFDGGYMHGSDVLPSATGNMLFDNVDGNCKVWTPDLVNQKGLTHGFTPIPAYDPNYFVAYAIDNNKPKIVVYNAGDLKPMVTRTDIEDLASGKTVRLPAFERVHLFPQLNLLVTLNSAGDQITMRKFNVLQELDASGLDYLLVASRSPWSVVKGDTYNYPLHILSKRGGTAITMQSGPAGMTLSPDGTLTWKVPTAFKEGTVTVTLLIKDDSGQEVLHAFEVRLLDPPPPEK